MNALVIRFSSLGDVVLSTSLVDALLESDPSTRVTVVTKAQYAPVWEHHSERVDVLPLETGMRLPAYLQQLRRGRFHVILDLHRSLRSRILLPLLKAKRVGRVRPRWITRQMMVRLKRGLERPLDRLASYYEAATDAGLVLHRLPTRIGLSGDERSRCDSIRSNGVPAIGFGWGARWDTKAVPVPLWIGLLQRLSGPSTVRALIFGLETDRRQIESAINALASDPSVTCEVHYGLPLREVAVRVAACGAFVSSDSGLAHMAMALNVPTAVLFGPTHPALGFGPPSGHSQAFHAGTYCSPCHVHGRAPCFRDRRYCFDEIDINAVAGFLRSHMTDDPMQASA